MAQKDLRTPALNLSTEPKIPKQPPVLNVVNKIFAAKLICESEQHSYFVSLLYKV